MYSQQLCQRSAQAGCFETHNPNKYTASLHCSRQCQATNTHVCALSWLRCLYASIRMGAFFEFYRQINMASSYCHIICKVPQKYLLKAIMWRDLHQILQKVFPHLTFNPHLQGNTTPVHHLCYIQHTELHYGLSCDKKMRKMRKPKTSHTSLQTKINKSADITCQSQTLAMCHTHLHQALCWISYQISFTHNCFKKYSLYFFISNIHVTLSKTWSLLLDTIIIYSALTRLWKPDSWMLNFYHDW